MQYVFISEKSSPNKNVKTSVGKQFKISKAKTDRAKLTLASLTVRLIANSLLSLFESVTYCTIVMPFIITQTASLIDVAVEKIPTFFLLCKSLALSKT